MQLNLLKSTWIISLVMIELLPNMLETCLLFCHHKADVTSDVAVCHSHTQSVTL
jgi:hypothetical protein